MCGYFGNVHECPAVIDLMDQLNIPIPFKAERAYQRRMYGQLIAHDGIREAMWWYAMRRDGDGLVINEKLTSFNARDLDKPLWKEASQTRRAIVFGSEVGESNGRNKYLMQSGEGFALGCLYKDWVTPDGGTLRSFSVITRPPHDRFSKYHEKSTPFFLPLDKSIIEEWLSPEVASSERIDDLLSQPKLYTNFEVNRVKTYKDAKPTNKPEPLARD